MVYPVLIINPVHYSGIQTCWQVKLASLEPITIFVNNYTSPSLQREPPAVLREGSTMSEHEKGTSATALHRAQSDR